MIAPVSDAVAFVVLRVLGDEGDQCLDHGDRRRVEGAVDASELAHDAVDLGHVGDRRVETAEHLLHFPDGRVGHGGGHVQERAFVEGRHVLVAQAGKDGRQLSHRRAGADSVGQKRRQAIRAEPTERAADDEEQRGRQKRGAICEEEAKQCLVEVPEEGEGAQDQARGREDEESVDEEPGVGAERLPVATEEHGDAEHGDGDEHVDEAAALLGGRVIGRGALATEEETGGGGEDRARRSGTTRSRRKSWSRRAG